MYRKGYFEGNVMS